MTRSSKKKNSHSGKVEVELRLSSESDSDRDGSISWPKSVGRVELVTKLPEKRPRHCPIPKIPLYHSIPSSTVTKMKKPRLKLSSSSFLRVPSGQTLFPVSEFRVDVFAINVD